MSTQAKRAYVSILSLIGLVVLLVELFAHVYDFMIGLIVAIVCWVGSGILGRYWGSQESQERRGKKQRVKNKDNKMWVLSFGL